MRVQGQYAKAEPLYERALVIREKTLGMEHPNVAACLNNLAELYRAQGRYGTAEPLYQRALAIWEKALGPEHPHVAICLENYALLLQKMRHRKEASLLEARANTIRAKNALIRVLGLLLVLRSNITGLIIPIMSPVLYARKAMLHRFNFVNLSEG